MGPPRRFHKQREGCGGLLTKLGYQAGLAANGAEGIEALNRVPYQTVVMDCQLPVIDGYAATAAI